MVDEQNPSNAPVTEVTQTEAPAEAERTFTLAEVEALTKQAKDAAFADARRTFTKPKQQEQQKQTNGKQGNGVVDLARREALNDALQDSLDGLSAAQKKAFRDLARMADPDDPPAWIAEHLQLFGKASAPTETQPPTQATKDPSVPPRQQPVVPPPPQGAPVWERPSNPFAWTEADIQALQAQKGIREANHIIRVKSEQFARNMRIQMGQDKRK